MLQNVDFFKTLLNGIKSKFQSQQKQISKHSARLDEQQTQIEELENKKIDAVLYTPQTLTEEQQKQARDNIGADVGGSGGYFEIRVTKSRDTYTADKTYDEIKVAIESGLTPVCRMKTQAADAILDDVFYYYNWQIVNGHPNANAFTFNNMRIGVSRFIAIYNSGTVAYFDDSYNFYTLPIATSTTLGGVKPVAKTDAMTQDVGVDKNGKLYTEPAEGVTPDIQIGTVETLPAGSDATASMGGTAENPLLNLGIPKGKDGAGMDITGAAAGQIAKISAVDENGKPTAWKPVDDRLPSVSTNDDGNILIVRQISEFEAAYVLEHMPNINDFINLGITDASPGQFAKVLAVDEFGQPTVWEPVDMPSGGEEWEELGTVDMSTADVVQLTFDSPVKKILIAASIIDSGYTSANSSNFYRTLSFKVGDEWRPHNFRIGASNHSWGIRNRIFFDCGVPGGDEDIPAGWGVRCSGLAGEAQTYGFPLHNGNAQQYITGYVSGVRLALTKPADTENTVTGTMKVWGIKA